MKVTVPTFKIPIAIFAAFGAGVFIGHAPFHGKHEIALKSGSRIESAAIIGATIVVPAGAENVAIVDTDTH